MSAIVIRADAAHLPLPDGSVDLIVTSPPYFGLRSYTDGGEHYDGQIGSEATPREYIAALLDCTREWVRVLKPEGSLFVNLGDKYSTYTGANWGNGRSLDGYGGTAKVPHGGPVNAPKVYGIPFKSLMMLPQRYAIGCIDDLGLTVRAEIVWSKPNGMPEAITDRVRRSHEQVFHLVKQPRYYSAADEIREPHISGGAGPTWAERKAAGQPPRAGDTGGGYSKAYPGPKAGHALGRLPGSVWTIPLAPLTVPAHLGVDHFAAFPPALVRPLILAWSPPSGVVLDPFGGSGTTAVVAAVYGRTGISTDMSADYCRLARWRVSDPAERARALDVPKPPPVPDGQGSLFDADSQLAI